MKNLIWKSDNDNKNGGYWICNFCGAVYDRPKNWNPIITWCMKCRKDWR